MAVFDPSLTGNPVNSGKDVDGVAVGVILMEGVGLIEIEGVRVGVIETVF